MDTRRITPLLLVCVFLGQFAVITEALNCLQCNVFSRGSLNTCEHPMNMSNCYACLKTYTKISDHENWLTTRSSDTVSRLCVVYTATAFYKPAGCYYQTNNGGYTVRCYCYSEMCNSAKKGQASYVLLLLPVVALAFLRLRD